MSLSHRPGGVAKKKSHKPTATPRLRWSVQRFLALKAQSYQYHDIAALKLRKPLFRYDYQAIESKIAATSSSVVNGLTKQNRNSLSPRYVVGSTNAT